MFSNLTLKKRLAMSFAAVLLTAIALIAIASINLSRLQDASGWSKHTYEVIAKGQGMLLNMVNIETGMRGFAASGKDNFLEPVTAGKEAFKTNLQQAKSLTADNAKQQDRLARIEALHVEFMTVADGLVEHRRAVTAGRRTLEEFANEFASGRDKKAMDAFRALIGEFIAEESGLLAQRGADADKTSIQTRQTLLVGGLLLCALVIGAGVLLARSVLGQLGGEPDRAAAVARSVAKGDLSQKISVKPGDTASLMAQLKAMQESLTEVVGGVRQGSQSVATASVQIAQGNQDLSQRTEEQASALQQTAATMEQLGTTVRSNADSAKQANQLAQGASMVAAQGGEVVGKVVTTMQDISESSRKIGDIIGVIDGIAFQTNILALNAAVEAARAGEQGRGFAVVAGEVRTLAQRSAEAAKEIKSLIGRSVEQVEQGTVLVDQAGKTMGEIVGSIQRVSDIVAEITSASIEQSAGIQQVGDAVSQMDQVTQQNAALVEESAAAAESLKSQAHQLVQAVAVFKLSSESREPASDASPALNAPSGERRGPNRAKNVLRPAFKTKAVAADDHAGESAPAKTGSDDWASF